MFDHNKLDEMKWLLDSGAEVKFDDYDFELDNQNGVYKLTVWDFLELVTSIRSKNWEEFKELVTKYMLNQ
ncbi:hypothetical protein [Cetobacterium sp.]|uniref:hypothetical protein n=1 Tax=Cetobacterium sp. TaxID=2071632 RepID=UPI003F3CA95D